MQNRIEGRAFVLGDNVDTDQIIPAQYLTYNPSLPEEFKMFGKHALSGVPDDAAGLPKGHVAFHGPDDEYLSPYRIVVANVLLNTLIELAPAIARKVASGGRLVLSGLLAAQADEAEAAYAALGLSPAGRAQRDGWARVELSRG